MSMSSGGVEGGPNLGRRSGRCHAGAGHCAAGTKRLAALGLGIALAGIRGFVG